MNFRKLAGLSLGLVMPTLSACHLLIGVEDADPVADGGTDSIGVDGVDGPSPGGGIFQLDEGCATDDLALDTAAIEDCLLRISCDPLVPPFTVSFCTTYGMGTERESTNSCVRGASDCSEVQYCLGRSY